MNALVKFCTSKDGIVVILALVLLGVVSHYNTANPWINLLARVGNLAIFVYILWRAAGSKIAAFFIKRRATIADELDALTARRQDAEQSLKNLQARIANLSAERDAILEESRQQAASVKATLLAQAQEEATKIREHAGRTAGSEIKSTIEMLRAQMADDIVNAVEEALLKRLTPSEHAKLIDSSLKKVVLH